MTKLRVTSVSSRASQVEDIVLRETENTKLLLRSKLVDNPNQPEACVKGQLIYQKRDDDGDYRDDVNILDLRKVKKGECAKWELKSEEVLNLLTSFDILKSIYQQHGLNFGESLYHIYEGNLDSAVEQLSQFEDVRRLLKSLSKLGIEDISRLSLTVSVSKLDKLLSIWKEHESDGDENFWQSTFPENSWVLSQIFACPFLYIDNQPYLGGKRGSGSGGVYSDMALKQQSSENIAFVEIKTPMTKIMNGTLLRGTSDEDTNAIYATSSELSSGINQSLNQRDTFLVSKNSLGSAYSTYKNPKCVIIIGKRSSLTQGQLRNFDFYRHNLHNMEILTYDELFERIQLLRECFLAP